jgi:hypothetical protein
MSERSNRRSRPDEGWAGRGPSAQRIAPGIVSTSKRGNRPELADIRLPGEHDGALGGVRR